MARQVKQARYAATRAERRYRAVDLENRLVARGLEAEWETALQAVREADAELDRRDKARPVQLSPGERAQILALGADLPALWAAPSTTDRDRKELLHALLDDVVVTVDDQARTARLVLHWKGGLVSQTSADLPRPKPPYRTSEDTICLIGRLAAHYDDSMIAKVLNQQQRRTSTGMSFTPANVATLYKRNAIPAHQDGTGHDEDGEAMSVHQAAAELGITASTLYRWLNDGYVPGEQITSGAPWRIRLTDSIRVLVADDAPAGWVPMQVATATLGVSRQTVLQRVKRGDLRAVHIRTGRRKGLRIELPAPRRPVLTIPRQSRSSVMTNRLFRGVTYQEDRSLVRTGNTPRLMGSLPGHQPAASERPHEHRCRQTATTPATHSGPCSCFRLHERLCRVLHSQPSAIQDK